MAVIAISNGTFHQKHQGAHIQSNGNDNLKHNSNHFVAAKIKRACAKILHKLIISGKNQNANTMAKDRFDIKEKETMNLLTETMVIVDKETGVNYLYVGRGYGGGLTPLLDADGKPIITKDGYKK